MSHNIPNNVVLHQTRDMKATSNGSTVPFIPFDVVEEILLNLDAQTLFQCAFLCRDWHSLITSPDFISRYLDQASDSRNKGLLLKIFHRKEGKKSVHRRLYFSLYYDNDQSDFLRTGESPQIDLFTQKKVVGASNGLVCLVDDDQLHEFIFWNPSIRRYVLLPRILTTSQVVASVGFGFDHRNKDFKVVKFVEHEDDDLYTVWVFSYATWSWKIIDSTPPLCNVEDQSHVLINGILYWVAWHLDRSQDFILTFDLSNEVFGQILLPQSIVDVGLVSIATTGDSLALLHTLQMDWAVWVMKQHDGVELWTNVVNNSNQALSIPRKVLAVCKNNDIILQMKDGQMLMYNPSTTTKNVIGVTMKGVEDSVLFKCHKSLYLLENNREEVKHYEY